MNDMKNNQMEPQIESKENFEITTDQIEKQDNMEIITKKQIEKQNNMEIIIKDQMEKQNNMEIITNQMEKQNNMKIPTSKKTIYEIIESKEIINLTNSNSNPNPNINESTITTTTTTTTEIPKKNQTIYQMLQSKENKEMIIEDALKMANSAINHLNKAIDYLESASNYGVWDLFGGGCLVSWTKHDKINNAYNEIVGANQYIKKLQKFKGLTRNIKEVIPIEIDERLVYRDICKNNICSDIEVQEKISETKKSCVETIYKLKSIINSFKRSMEKQQQQQQQGLNN
ncbi:hypothetical protein BCR32DRAFT_242991 [Anaeromyces robustus]|uniref:Uncharacterized protein n=1 Tax=Anaeromyces robustus TaxID=1754192 RepID=A0A1Y1XDT7_9FUNG|nr:hypothetical protein BCR32DRAFT_242991 [Anaeromyces robustus]|eukprot:ORX83941.1 hypothetical protein BCR32DRAFT_242991 [Anaeromyces robustus]